MGKRANGGGSRAGRDLGQAGQTVLAVDVHGTGTADTFTARSSESQREGVVDLVLDLEQSVENHGAAAIQLRKRIESNSLRSITYFS